LMAWTVFPKPLMKRSLADPKTRLAKAANMKTSEA
jgi:hypothetical protein